MTAARALDGSFDQHKIGFAQFLNRWFTGVQADYADTKAVQAFLAKPFNQAFKWAPARMIDLAEEMLDAYRRNQNGPAANTTLFPVVLMAMDDNFVSTGADWGGIHTPHQYVQIEDGGSWYGHTQVMQDRRVQVVIVASEGGTAQSLAAQLSNFVKQYPNRYMSSVYTFGQYQVDVPMTLETVRLDWMDIKLDGIKNMKMLAADFSLKCTVPYFDAPADGAANDGSTNLPPGYPVVKSVVQVDQLARLTSTTDADGETWGGAL